MAADWDNHVKIAVLSDIGLCFAFNCTMSSGSLKCCVYHSFLKLLFQRISDIRACVFYLCKMLRQSGSVQHYRVRGGCAVQCIDPIIDWRIISGDERYFGVSQDLMNLYSLFSRISSSQAALAT